MSAIIFVKYLVHLLYDLMIYFYGHNDRILIYLFTISFYSTEIALVLLMSRSIREATKAEKQYNHMTSQIGNASIAGGGPGGGTPQYSMYKKQGDGARYRSQNPMHTMQSILSSSEQTKAGSPAHA